MKKIEVKDECRTYSFYDLEGNLQTIIGMLQNLSNEFSGYTRFELSEEYDAWSDRSHLVVYGYRMETDQELAKREKKVRKEREKKRKEEAKKKASIEEQQRKTLEHLVKKNPEMVRKALEEQGT